MPYTDGMNTYRIALDNWHNAVDAAKPAFIAEQQAAHLATILNAKLAKATEDKPAATKLGKRERNAAKKALGKDLAAALKLAKDDVTKHFYWMPELAGLTNPWKDDPDFGWGAEEAEAPFTPGAVATNKHGGTDIKTAKPVRANKYGGKCTKCGGWVEAGDGALAKDSNGKWAADHIGECPKVEAKPEAAATGLDLSGLVQGYYAVPGGDTRLKLAISHGKNNWEGCTFVKDGAHYGAGNRYGMQRPGQTYKGKVEAELAIILADPKAALAAYGKLVGKCGACGRVLEDQDSKDRGIGPVCLVKYF